MAEGSDLSQEKLPEELSREVLARVPVRSLLRARTLNRGYQALVTERSFMSLHHGHSPYFLLLHHSLHPSLHHDHGLLNQSSTLRFPFVDEHVPVEHLQVAAVCDGLVCVLLSRHVLICNPAIRRGVYVGMAPIPSGLYVYRYGLGLDPSTSNYKLVRIRVDLTNRRTNVSPPAAVYSLEDRAWRDVQTPAFTLRMHNILTRYVCPRHGVVVQGFLHWAAKRWLNHEWYYFILFFNFVNDTFGELLLPDILARPSSPCSAFDRGVFVIVSGKEKPLTVYHMDRRSPATFSCGIWVMHNYGVTDSWTQLFTFDFSQNYVSSPALGISLHDIVLADAPLPLLHRNSGELLFLIELDGVKSLYSLNLHNRTSIRLPIDIHEDRDARFLYAGYYSESLHLLDQPTNPL